MLPEEFLFLSNNYIPLDILKNVWCWGIKCNSTTDNAKITKSWYRKEGYWECHYSWWQQVTVLSLTLLLPLKTIFMNTGLISCLSHSHGKTYQMIPQLNVICFISGVFLGQFLPKYLRLNYQIWWDQSAMIEQPILKKLISQFQKIGPQNS